MQIIKKCKHDLLDPGMPLWFSAMQNDHSTRYLELMLLSDGKVWLPPDGAVAAVSYRRGDGAAGMYDTLDDGTPAVTITGNTLRVCIHSRMLVLSGTVSGSVVLCHEGKQLSTFPFFIRVTADPAAGRPQDKGSQIPILAGLHSQLNTLQTHHETDVTQLRQAIAQTDSRILTQEQLRALVSAWMSGTSDINIRKWFHKKIVVDGSSITAGGLGNTLPTWPSFLKDMFALDTVYNHAVSGTGWFTGSPSLLSRIADYEADADAVILMGDYNGIYNYQQNVGTIDDAPAADGSCYARLKHLAQMLIAKYPLCPVIWVIEPPRAQVNDTESGTVPMQYASQYQQYSRIIRQVAELYGFCHCDLMKNTLFRPWVGANFEATTADGVHPFNNIQRTMAQVIAETMKRTPLMYNESYVVAPDTDASGDTSADKALTALSVTPVSGYSLYENDTLSAVSACVRVVAGYSDLSEAEVTDFAVSGTLRAGAQVFTVTYGGISAAVTLTVTAGYRTRTLALREQNVTEGVFLLKINGVETPSENAEFGHTDYIPVLGGTDVVFSGLAECYGLNNGFSEYDANKQHINFVDTNYGTHTYTLSQNAAYIRVNLHLQTTDTITIVAV